MSPRCVNLDWLEVFACELSCTHDAEYFRHRGFIVHEREYGTRIYNEMFTLEDNHGEPFVEVRRNPKNPLISQHATHIRFVNRACYLPSAAALMQDFLDKYDYEFLRISRVDICLDFVRFDDNTIPRVFMQRYMRGKFSKINQANIHSHGTDTWTGRVWNSVSWGSPSSMISTKFYNKTLELYNPKDDSFGKPYIRQAWHNAGLIDNIDRCTLNNVQQEIWRVEFSIKSSVKRWFVIELNGKAKQYQSIHNTLDCYDSKPKLLTLFASLAQHYFHFKRYIMEQRKDRCPDRRLFNFSSEQLFFKPEHNVTLSSSTPDPLLLLLIKHLKNFLDKGATIDTRPKATELLRQLQALQLRQEVPAGVSAEERIAWQATLSGNMLSDHFRTYSQVLDEVKKLLALNDRTIIF